MRVRWGRLAFLGLVAFPVVEVWLALQLAATVGGWWAVAVLGGLSALGVLVLRHEGPHAWAAFVEPVRAGRRPPDDAADGLVLLLAGCLLVVPGLITGLVGLLLLVPGVRRRVRRAVARRAAGRVVVVGRGQPPRTGSTGGAGGAVRPGPASPGPVIPGEVVDPE